MASVTEQFVGATAYDVSGDKIGKINHLYVDAHSREPKWASVHTGLFGLSESIIPLTGARRDGDAVTVTVGKDAVKDAPPVKVRQGITPHEEHRLERHYRLDGEQPTAPEPPHQHPHRIMSAGRGAAAAAAGIGGTATNTSAYAPEPEEDPDEG